MTDDSESKISEGGRKILGIVVRVGILLLLEHVPVNGNSTKLILTGGKLFNFVFQLLLDLLELFFLFRNAGRAVEVNIFLNVIYFQLDAFNMEPKLRNNDYL